MVNKLKEIIKNVPQERPSDDTQVDLFSGYAGLQSVSIRRPTHDNIL